MATEQELRDAVQTVAEGAGQISTAEDAIEAAQAAREAAEDAAEEIAEAAMEGERGRRIEALETECAIWPEKLATAISNLRTEFLAMVANLTPLPAQAPEATAATEATAAAAQAAASSGQTSQATVTETTTATVDPAPPVPVAEAVPQAAPAKRKPNWI